jgi:GT2 family glycosyltransferase
MLSVVVGTLNRLDRLRDCIESIKQTSIPVKIYLTDAGSVDGTIDYLRKIESDSINVTLHDKKLGQATAYNEIFSNINSDYTCWLSDDNVIINEGLENAVRVLNDNPLVGMVGLKVKDVQGPFSSEPYIGGLSEAGILNVNQGVIRTVLLQKLGGFSEEFMNYGIDPDLTARVLFSGYDIVYTKKITVLHYRDWGESEIYNAQIAKQEVYKELYRKKYFHSISQWPKSRFWFFVLSGVKYIALRTNIMFGRTWVNNWVRDLYNIVLGRYISLFDPIKSMGKDFHLIQHCDRETIDYYANRLFQRGK